MLSKINSL